MSDYENYDNLAFEPELTWDELCEYAKIKGLRVWGNLVSKHIPQKGDIIIHKTGKVAWTNYIGSNNYIIEFAENRTYEQMKAIIEALWGE